MDRKKKETNKQTNQPKCIERKKQINIPRWIIKKEKSNLDGIKERNK